MVHRTIHPLQSGEAHARRCRKLTSPSLPIAAWQTRDHPEDVCAGCRKVDA